MRFSDLNPSSIIVRATRIHKSWGRSTIFPSLEGTRPILVEVHALVSNANFGTPQRNSNGIDYKRLAMLLAVLEKRIGMPIGAKDVFINLVGGFHMSAPSTDLAVIIAVASSAKDFTIPNNTVLAGEVGLSGELRSVPNLDKRIKASEALGFTNIIVPITAPGIVSSAILTAFLSWNEFLIASSVARRKASVLSMAVASYVTDKGILWGQMAAMSIIMILPMILFALFVQRYLVKGIMLGAVKQ